MAMTGTADGVAELECFTVLVDPHGQPAGTWDDFVRDVGVVLGLRPAFLPAPAVEEGWIRRVLHMAVEHPGPVLVLPGGPVGGLEALTSSWPPRLHQAVIASDDSREVIVGARLCALHLLRNGVPAKVLLVLDQETAPPIWEGHGHHAEAWRAELERRYGPADSVEILHGPPGAAVRARAARADLVVLLWRGSLGESRARVVRTVLDEGSHQPCLLVPVPWVTYLERRVESARHRATGRVRASSPLG